MDKGDMIIVLIIGSLIGLTFFGVLAEIESSKWHNKDEFQAEVIDSSYKPDTRSTSPVVGVTGNGQVAVGVASSGSSEAWYLIVKLPNGKIEKAAASVNAVYKYRKGEMATCHYAIGKLTGIKYKGVRVE